MKRASLVGVVPAGALLVLALVAAAHRLGRPLPSSVASSTATTSAEAGPASTGLDAPLRAATDAAAPDASGIAAAPRTLHGAPTHVHRASGRGPTTIKPRWRVEVGGPVAAQVTASPDERTLYVATLAGAVVALRRDDGARAWTVQLTDKNERVYSTPLIADDGTLFVGTDAKKLVALDPKGTVRWRLEVDGEADTAPVFGPGGLVVFGAGSAVHAARRGGDLAWRFATKGKVFTSPAITADGHVVVGSQDDHVYCLGPDGALAWSVDLGADVDGSPAIADDGAIYVGTDKGEVVRLDAKGNIAWRTAVGGFVRGPLAIARDGDVLAGTYGPVPRVVRVSPAGAIRGAFAIRGTGAREFGIHGGPLEDGAGTLYFGTQDDGVYAVARSGELLFRYETRGDVDAPLTMLGDGSLVVASEDGTVALLGP